MCLVSKSVSNVAVKGLDSDSASGFLVACNVPSI